MGGDVNNQFNTNLTHLDSSSLARAQALPRWFLDLSWTVLPEMGFAFPAIFWCLCHGTLAAWPRRSGDAKSIAFQIQEDATEMPLALEVMIA